MNIDSAKIKKYLDFDCEVEVLETVDSTNLYLKRKPNTSSNVLVISKTQTAGKGRHGKSFYSDENGIYMSFMLNKTIPVSEVYLLTTTAAVAVAETLNDLYKIDAKIKWVNDVYCNNKKLCGILCEGVLNSDGVYEKSIVGIGINVFKPYFPAEIYNTAISLEDVVERSKIKRNLIIASIVNKFHTLINSLTDIELVEKYKSLSFMIGKTITVSSVDGDYSAKVLDIDNSAQLVIQKQSGEVVSLNSGEISIKI